MKTKEDLGGWVRDAAYSSSFPAQYKPTEEMARAEAQAVSLRYPWAYVTVIRGTTNDPNGERLATFRKGEAVALYPTEVS
jgi:hypothetical protein